MAGEGEEIREHADQVAEQDEQEQREDEREEAPAFRTDRLHAHVVDEFVDHLGRGLQPARHHRARPHAGPEQAERQHLATTIIRFDWLKFDRPADRSERRVQLELAHRVDRARCRHCTRPQIPCNSGRGPVVSGRDRSSSVASRLSAVARTRARHSEPQPRPPAGRTHEEDRPRAQPPVESLPDGAGHRQGTKPVRARPAARSPARRAAHPGCSLGGLGSSPCRSRAARSRSWKEAGPPCSSVMFAPGKSPCRRAGACYRRVLQVSRMGTRARAKRGSPGVILPDDDHVAAG